MTAPATPQCHLGAVRVRRSKQSAAQTTASAALPLGPPIGSLPRPGLLLWRLREGRQKGRSAGMHGTARAAMGERHSRSARQPPLPPPPSPLRGCHATNQGERPAPNMSLTPPHAASDPRHHSCTPCPTCRLRCLLHCRWTAMELKEEGGGKGQLCVAVFVDGIGLK